MQTSSLGEDCNDIEDGTTDALQLKSANNLYHSGNLTIPGCLEYYTEEVQILADSPDTRRMVVAHYGCIENMDDAIGRVMKKIKEMGIAGETLVIFTSDNGSRFPGSNGILRGQKGLVWEGGIRVPAIFYWEGRISPHWDQDAPCGVIDLFPTFCELTNNENAMSFATDGESLMPIIDNKPFERKKPMFSFHHHNAMASLRENEWNLIGFLYPESPGPSRFRPEHIEYMRTAKLVKYELYNLEKDTGQNNDLSRVFPEIVEKMQKTMKELYEEVVFEGVDWFSDPYTKTETK